MRPTRKRRWTAVLISSAAIAGLAGCGGSSSSSSSTSVAKAPQVTPLGSRTLTAGELPGFAPVGARSFQTDARLWLIANQVPPNQAHSQTAWLHKLGFVGGAREDLANQRAGGLSLVEQFPSTGAARKELAMQLREFKTGIPRDQASSFAITGIPGLNVAFVVGPYYYLVGVGWPSGEPNASTMENLVTAARHLYGRVRR